MHRRLVSLLVALLLALLGVVPIARDALAQSFPPKSVRIIVPWPPGGLSDIVCRHLQQPLADVLGVPVVIENKTGASGLIGTEAIARSPADGTVIGTVGSSHASNTALFAKLPYDAVADFKPITILTRSPNIVGVHRNAVVPSCGAVDAKTYRHGIRCPSPAAGELRTKPFVANRVHFGADFGEIIVDQLGGLATERG